MPSDTIPSRLFDRAASYPDRAAYHVRTDSGWQPTTWREYADDVLRAGKALVALGLQPGDVCCILGFNRPEWIVLDVACMAVGGIPTGIYPTCSPEEIRYILEHTGAPLLLLETDEHWRRVEAGLAEGEPSSADLRHVVSMRGGPTIDDGRSLSWEAFLALGDGLDDDVVHERTAALRSDALGTLIYTSGTTGPPKGVMLSHENLTWTSEAMQRSLDATESDQMVSYLPLSHVAEQMFTIHSPITVGYPVYFAESVKTIARDIQEVRPTLLFGVPRIWEKFHAGILGKLGEAKGVKKRLVSWARGAKRRADGARASGRTPGGLQRMQVGLAERLVFSKLRGALGLDRTRICVSGAAPLAADVMDDLASLGITVLEVYGQSEASGPTSFNFPREFLVGSVGRPLEGVEVRIADDGEILVRGSNVFMGYYRDDTSTTSTLDDGWLSSGDLGRIDDRGFLHIVGRKKDIIITAGGKNVAPQNIENALKQSPIIEEAVVIGDRRRFLSALVTLDADQSAAWAEREGVDAPEPHRHPRFVEEVERAVAAANERFAQVEQIKRFTILEHGFTIESGELTPTMKIKRQVIETRRADAIDAMYETGTS